MDWRKEGRWEGVERRGWIVSKSKMFSNEGVSEI